MNFYRTAKGSHRHANYECANQRRAITSGVPAEIPAGEVSSWAACAVCCDDATVKASVVATAVALAEMCTNSGVRNPRRIESECRDCGKRGKVNRTTGKIRGHNA